MAETATQTLDDFLSHFGRVADDVISIVDFRVEVPSWDSWLAFHTLVARFLLRTASTTMLSRIDTISVTRESILIKGSFLWVEMPPEAKDAVTLAYESEFEFSKPIPSLEVPVVEDSAHPKGAQNGESQPQ